MSDMERVLSVVLEEVTITPAEIEEVVSLVIRNWRTIQQSISSHIMKVELAGEALDEQGPFKDISGLVVPDGQLPSTKNELDGQQD